MVRQREIKVPQTRPAAAGEENWLTKDLMVMEPNNQLQGKVKTCPGSCWGPEPSRQV